jgi:hypothetical protein
MTPGLRQESSFAMTKQTSAIPLPATPVISLGVKIVFNIAIVAATFASLKEIDFLLPTCTSPAASQIALTLLVWLLAQLAWRAFGDLFKQSATDTAIEAYKLKVPLQLLAGLADSIALRELTDRWLLGLLGLGTVGLVGLWGANASGIQILPVTEETPYIQQFSVEVGGRPQTFLPEEVIQLSPGQALAVKADRSSPEGSCSWTSAIKGDLPGETGCALQYSPPLGRDIDVLTLQTQSPCKTNSDIAHLDIIVHRP